MHDTERRVGVLTHVTLMAIPIVIAVAVGCSSGDADGDDASGTTGTTDTTAVQDVVVIAADFKPLAEMTR
ncbi:MAG: hypothetical protein ACRDIL_07730, partial [Candidatus Limnocylindrales bacterium]